MKVMTILGTRPEIIRLSRIIPKLDELCDHVLVHTGQNYDDCLSKVFFDELNVRAPDYRIDAGGGWFATQVSNILSGVAHALDLEKPDRVLILGDTNSGLSALAARRMGIPVYHLEAGNRCYDDRVPEETNRRVIDHCSDVLMPYTERSRANLLREGIDGQRIFVVGNPIGEVLEWHKRPIEDLAYPQEHGVKSGVYFLATVHRAESVDNKVRLRAIIGALATIGTEWNRPVLCSLHPHTQQRMNDFGVEAKGVRLLSPLGFYDFVGLEKNAFCVLTDSGTVPEECCILRVPCVTLRDVTERPEMVECGGSILAGVESENVLRAVKAVTSGECNWTPPPEYLRTNVSDTVCKIVLGQ